MTLIDGDKIITAQLYDDEHEEFKEEKMSIIEYVNLYTNEGVTTSDDILDKVRAKIAEYGSIMVAYAITKDTKTDKGIEKLVSDVLKQAKEQVLEIIDKYRAEVEE